jgi:hypothetical protein
MREPLDELELWHCELDHLHVKMIGTTKEWCGAVTSNGRCHRRGTIVEGWRVVTPEGVTQLYDEIQAVHRV